jgi:hypothetical protein
MYIRAQQRYLRENVSFKTGLEGHIPSYGDLISVGHDLPRWGSAGIVLDITGTTLTLSEDVTFGVGSHWIVLRKKDGSQAGPFSVVAGSQPNKVVAAGGVGSDFFFDGIHERPLFLFGKTDQWGKLMTVVSLMPDEDEVEVKAVVYNPTIFSFDSLTPPPLANPTLPPVVPDLPTVANLLVTAIVGTTDQVLISWSPAVGATAYTINKSTNGIDWDAVDTTLQSSYVLTVPYAYIYIRVYALGKAAGPWAYWSGHPVTNTLVNATDTLTDGSGNILKG